MYKKTEEQLEAEIIDELIRMKRFWQKPTSYKNHTKKSLVDMIGYDLTRIMLAVNDLKERRKK